MGWVGVTSHTNCMQISLDRRLVRPQARQSKTMRLPPHELKNTNHSNAQRPFIVVGIRSLLCYITVRMLSYTKFNISFTDQTRMGTAHPFSKREPSVACRVSCSDLYLGPSAATRRQRNTQRDPPLCPLRAFKKSSELFMILLDCVVMACRLELCAEKVVHKLITSFWETVLGSEHSVTLHVPFRHDMHQRPS